MYIDFFNTHVQRTALTIAANCCRNISSDAFGQVQEIVPILTNTITYSDQRVVEQSCLCWLRLAKSFKHQRESLEAIVSEDLLKTMVGFIAGSGSSNSVGPQVFSSLMQFLGIVAKSSPTLRVKLLSENVVDILFHILTGGVAPPTEDLQSTIVVSSIAPKSNNAIFEILDILVGLLPDLPSEGIFSTKPQPLLKPDGNPVEAPIASRTRSSHSRTNSDEVTVDESVTLWRERPHIAERVCQIMVPTMFEVYSSTVNLQIRQVVMTMLLKIVYFSDTQVLERVLITIPLAGFIAGVLAQKEHSSLVVTALQLADLLLTKLPSLYTSHFETEGVIFEIRRLASSCDESPANAEEAKASSSSTSSEKPPTEEETQESSQASAAEKLESELQAIFGERELDASFTSGMRLFDRLKKSSVYMSGSNKSLGQKDTQEWISITAQNFLILYANTTKSSDTPHTADTDHLKLVAESLQGISQEMTPKAALQEIAARYKSGLGISSFELMNTGLIDGLLSYVTTSGTEGKFDRRAKHSSPLFFFFLQNRNDSNVYLFHSMWFYGA
jgi:E3 ubiquitin-protein ligase TRIP12